MGAVLPGKMLLIVAHQCQICSMYGDATRHATTCTSSKNLSCRICSSSFCPVAAQLVSCTETPSAASSLHNCQGDTLLSCYLLAVMRASRSGGQTFYLQYLIFHVIHTYTRLRRAAKPKDRYTALLQSLYTCLYYVNILHVSICLCYTTSLILWVRRGVEHSPVTIFDPSPQVLAFDDFRVSDISVGLAASCQHWCGHITWGAKWVLDLEYWFASCDEVLVDAALAVGDTWERGVSIEL